VECVVNCEICAAKSNCLSCKKGFYLKSADSCVSIRTLIPELRFGAFYTLVILDFLSPTQLFVDKFSSDIRSFVNVSISDLTSNDFSFSVGKNSSSTLQFSFDYRLPIPKGTLIEMKVIQYEWMTTNIEEILGIYSYSLSFPEELTLCPKGFIRSAGH
jgi:hypothetical protein